MSEMSEEKLAELVFECRHPHEYELCAEIVSLRARAKELQAQLAAEKLRYDELHDSRFECRIGNGFFDD